jgi:uncharacterized membrane protein
MIDLGTLGGSTSRPAAINDKGQVVAPYRRLATPFLYSADDGRQNPGRIEQ